MSEKNTKPLHNIKVNLWGNNSIYENLHLRYYSYFEFFLEKGDFYKNDLWDHTSFNGKLQLHSVGIYLNFYQLVHKWMCQNDFSMKVALYGLKWPLRSSYKIYKCCFHKIKCKTKIYSKKSWPYVTFNDLWDHIHKMKNLLLCLNDVSIHINFQ